MIHQNEIAYVVPKRVLVVVAHPDDIDFGVAGSVARWVGEGAEVTYCIITNGAAGSNDPATDLRELVRTREQEQRAAAAVVGVRDVRFLGYQDGVLQPTLELRRDITRIIREVQPDRVVTQDPTTVFASDSYINHPDHRAAGEATLYAVFPSAETRPVFPELLAEGLEPHHVNELYLNLTLNPNTAIDISEVIDRKMEALLCHTSQNTAEAADWLRERNAEAGKAYDYAYAEVFRVMRFIRGQEVDEEALS
ncbi:MAG: PIG-L family deacetylase [Chloroflexaceae bacterium]|nr:PIG-L family deacetylase [Chloroflexaceae bacterium]NJL34382.1 PIG-L family deacetylase [Chloroflexaceae bacterium]NJO04590.1 PIG-L family deacetylase [Chloroflexaceae bacterium]